MNADERGFATWYLRSSAFICGSKLEIQLYMAEA